MAKPKNIKPIVRFDHTPYVFDNLSQAADAIKFFGKLKRVTLESDPSGSRYYFRPADEQSEISLDNDHEFCPTPKRIALPAPKRGHVPCAVCESVSVKPGTACESCGTISPPSVQ